MILPKELSAPAFYRRSVRLKPEAFSELRHMRRSEGALVVAEGAERLGSLPAGTRRVYAPFYGRICSYADGKLVCGERELPLGTEPAAVVRFLAADGTEELWTVTDDARTRISDGLSVTGGGTCAFVHYERLFTGKGNRLNFTAPLNLSSSATATQGAGSLELPADGGDILAITALKEELLVFREHTVTRLYCRGDVLDFRVYATPFSCGKLYGKTVRRCGNAVLFCTESGLFSYGGGKCGQLYAFTPPEGVSANCDGERYCVRVSDERLLIRDGEIHSAELKTDFLAEGDELLYGREGELFRLGGSGLPDSGQPCARIPMRNFFAKSAYLDGVAVEGRGYLSVLAVSDRGEIAEGAGRAGEFIRFPVPVRGAGFSLEIRTDCADARVDGALLRAREDRR